MRPLDPARRFGLGALLWMPVTFGIWWFGGWAYFVLLLAPLLKAALALLIPDYFLGFRGTGSVWYLHTTLSPLHDPLALLSIQIPPIRYTVSFPLFWGLALATPIPWKERGYQLLVGTALVVVPAVLLMILLYALFQLGITINHQAVLAQLPPVDWYLAAPLPDWLFYLLGVGRQVSTLVLPLVIPVLAWAGLNGTLLREALVRVRRESGAAA